MRFCIVGVRRRKVAQMGNDLVHCIAHLEITPDEVGVLIRENDRRVPQMPAVPEIEEHRAAAKKRLEVGADALGVVVAEMPQQLTLAARPLQKRAQFE